MMSNKVSHKVELAKRADHSAKNYALKTLQASAVYKEATEADRKAMEEAALNKVLHKQ